MKILKSGLLLVMLLSGSLLVQAQKKNVLLEEHTGAWCQYCPGGAVLGDSISKTNPQAIVVSVHSIDPMKNTEHLDIGPGTMPAPTAWINRTQKNVSVSNWFGATATEGAKSAIADVEVQTNYNSTTRELKINLTSAFSSSVTGDYRFAAIIAEDGVHGTSSGYNQSNAYAGGDRGQMGGFETFPGKIPANQISYNHVSRKLFGGAEGEAGSLPSNLESGKTYGHTFTYILPDDWNENHIYAIGMLIAPDRKIENCGKAKKYITGSDNALPQFNTDPVDAANVGVEYIYDIFTTDANDKSLQIIGADIPAWLTLGQTTNVFKIHSRATLKGTPSNTGKYKVKLQVTDGKDTTDQEFEIEVKAGFNSSWWLVGKDGFTASEARVTDMVCKDDGVCFAAVVENKILRVYRFTEAQGWTVIGGDISSGASSYHAKLALSSTGIPYIVYSNGGIYCYYLDGTTWQPVGSSFTTGVQLGLTLNDKDQPIVTCQDGGSNYEGTCWMHNGTEWVKVGGKSYSGNAVAGVWTDVEFHNGKIYALWTDFRGSRIGEVRRSFLSVWDGSSWSDLGDSGIINKGTYFYQALSIGKDGNPVIAIVNNDEQIDVVRHNGTKWEVIGADVTKGAIEYVDLDIAANGDVAIAYRDVAFGNKVSAMRYDGVTWDQIGQKGLSPFTDAQPFIDYAGDIPYVVYENGDMNNRLSARRFSKENLTVKELSFAREMILYPNPANEVIVLQHQFERPVHACIQTVYGKVVKKLVIESGKAVDVSDLSNGTYILTTPYKSQKLVIRH